MGFRLNDLRIDDIDTQVNNYEERNYDHCFAMLRKFIIFVEIYHCDKSHHLDENSSSWRKIIILSKIHRCDENSSLWWKFIVVLNIQMFKTLMKVMILMKTHPFDDNLYLWWKIILGMKDLLRRSKCISVIEFCPAQSQLQLQLSWRLSWLYFHVYTTTHPTIHPTIQPTTHPPKRV